MTIETASWHEILQVLHESYQIWSAGLNACQYQEYIWRRMTHPWGRKHSRYIIYKSNGEVASSCKTYDLTMTSHGRDYRVIGIGSVFTRMGFRGMGIASRMLEEVVETAKANSYDGLLLFSEIGPSLYEPLGFEELGTADFCIFTQGRNGTKAKDLPHDEPDRDGFNVSTLSYEHIPSLERHHRRWLSRQAYGCRRTPSYWQFKLMKEKFLHANSRLSWPELKLITVNAEQSQPSYMIIEEGGGTIRLLEIVGTADSTQFLWNYLLRRALAQNCQRLRGWEAGVQILAPTFSLKPILSEDMRVDDFEPLVCTERDWGRAMILPLNPEIKPWIDQFPCPLLELDHF